MSAPVSLFDIQPLLAPIDAGYPILTANQRLASRIVTAFALHRQSLGASVVEQPRVMAYEHWLQDCWRRGRLASFTRPEIELRELPTAAQELVTWQQVIEMSPAGEHLLRPAATALQAASAYRQLCQWRLDWRGHALRAQFAEQPDSAALLAWIDAFEQRCEQWQWLPTARLAEAVAELFAAQVLAAETAIVTVGFEELTPAQRHVLQAAGPLHEGDGPGRGGANRAQVVACEDADAELYAAAVWAKQILKESPQQTVALVIPDLGSDRARVVRALLQVFDTLHNDALAAPQTLPFNISAGYTLIDAPVIRAALDCLALCGREIPLTLLEQFLQSPFHRLSDDSNVAQRDCLASLLVNLRGERRSALRPARLRQLAQSVADTAPDLAWPCANALQTLANTLREAHLERPRALSDWLPLLQQVLDTLGWPGQRVLDSEEFQQCRQWQALLDTLPQLDEVCAALSFERMLSTLRNQLGQRSFQPQSPDSPLQVLGTLEAAGLSFDHLWLMSMSDREWPPRQQPNPFIPASLQRSQGMPHASAERELAYARALGQRLLQSAQAVVVSYARQIDEAPAAISPLFAQLPTVSLEQLFGKRLEQLLPLPEWRRRHWEQGALVDYAPGAAPPYAAEETVRGGSALLGNQSACAFKAFAVHRLGLRALDEPVTGPDAAELGQLLHRALELIWRRLERQEALLALDDTQREALTDDVIHFVLEESVRRGGTLLGKRLRALLFAQLRQRVLDWLAFEAERAPFVVDQLESRQRIAFGPLTLNARIDRVDLLKNEQRLIIDYKTGAASIGDWWGDRPRQPQLPLYSTVLEGSVAGIAFARITADKKKELLGVGAENLDEPSLRWSAQHIKGSGVLEWPLAQQQWQRTLTRLAAEFIGGGAEVDPRPDSCRYCDLAAVCRIDHGAGVEADSEDGAATDEGLATGERSS